MNIDITPTEVSISAQAADGTILISPPEAEINAKSSPFIIALGNPVIREIVGGESYTGSYTVTPSQQEQTLETGGKLMARNVTVGAIPQNYGLITWNGAVLTVS